MGGDGMAVRLPKWLLEPSFTLRKRDFHRWLCGRPLTVQGKIFVTGKHKKGRALVGVLSGSLPHQLAHENARKH